MEPRSRNDEAFTEDSNMRTGNLGLADDPGGNVYPDTAQSATSVVGHNVRREEDDALPGTNLDVPAVAAVLRNDDNRRGGDGASTGPEPSTRPTLGATRDIAAERPAHPKPVQQMVVLTAQPLTAGEKVVVALWGSWPPLPDTSS